MTDADIVSELYKRLELQKSICEVDWEAEIGVILLVSKNQMDYKVGICRF